MSIIHLREKIPNDIFGTLEIQACLDGYANKAAKIALWIRRGEIVQIRRGLYTFATALRRAPLSAGLLANKIYGPSYVSAEYALSYYGLIPESVEVVTSLALGRSRIFRNSFGNFSYRHCCSGAYPIGVTTNAEDSQRFLIATPEKAFFDKIHSDTRFDGEDVESYLWEDLRLDPEGLAKMNKDTLAQLAPYFRGRLKGIYRYLQAL